MKKILGIILAAAMLISLVPSAFASTEEENSTLIYNFTVSAIADESIIATSADGKNTKSVQWNLVTSTSQLDSEVSTGLWTFVASPGFYNGVLYSSSVQARVDLAHIEANGTVLKTSFAENATYSAGVEYTKNAANGRTNVYLVPVAEATANSWDMTTATGVNAAIAASEDSTSSVALAASVDMHLNATDANPCEGNTFDVTAGEYYIVISVRKGCTETANDRYFTMIKSLTLTEQEKTNDETEEISEIDITYSFTTGGRPDVTSSGYLEYKDGTWDSGYKKYPSAPTDPGQMWAYLGTTAEKAATPSAYVSISALYTGSGFTGTSKGQFIAFKFRVPYTGKYIVSDFVALKYKNASELLNIYIIPMDKDVFAEGNVNTYGTVADSDGDSYYNRTGKKSADVATADDIVATTNIYQTTAEYTNATLTGTKAIDLEKDTDYVLLFAHDYASNRAITPTSITLRYIPNATEEYIALATSTSITPDEIDIVGDSYKRGDSVVAEADESITVGDVTYIFRHWVRGTATDGEVVSKSARYTFTIMTNTYLTAVYTEETTGSVVEFYNANGDYIATKSVSDGKVELPDEPVLTGFKFLRWIVDKVGNESVVFDENNVTGEITYAVAEFTDDTEVTFAVEGESEAVTYDTQITRSSADGEEKAWKRNGVLVGYGESYTFNVWDTVSAITQEAIVTKAPVVVLDEKTKTTGSDTAYMIEYDGADEKIEEVGILFGKAGTTPAVESCMYKATSQTNGGEDGHGQFTAKQPNSDYSVARGYLIYSDNGVYRVVYSDN